MTRESSNRCSWILDIENTMEFANIMDTEES